MKKTAPESVVEEKPHASMTIDCPKGAKMDFDTGDCEVDEEMTITVTGRVKSIRYDEYGKNVQLEPTKVSASYDKVKGGMKDDLKELRKSRTV